MKKENKKLVLSKIKNKKIILSDCFDTIIFRKIEEQEVEKLYFEKISIILGVEQNFLLRLWKELKKTSLCFDGRDERTFREIVIDIFYRIQYIKKLSIDEEEFYNLCLNNFIQVEIKSCSLNKSLIYKLYEAKKNGKIIICVSDFFLPKKFFIELFKELKIEDLFSDIIVSSDIGKRKSTGKLYEHIKFSLEVDGNDCLMIGDNKISDCFFANENGIESIQYFIEKKNETKDLLLEKLYELYSKNCKNNLYLSNYSFSLFLFCESLYNTLKQNQIKKIYFLSREGEFLKELFEIYLRDKKYKIKMIYLYVSRKSTYLPSLLNIEDEKFYGLMKDSPNISVNSFLKSLNLYDIYYNSDISNNEKEKNQEIIIDFFESEEFKKLKNNNCFKQVFEEQRIKQKKEIMKYFENLGLIKEREVHIVDIGWKGTIQDNIFRIFDSKKVITGYYYGLYGKVDISLKNLKYGLVFSDIPLKTNEFDMYKIRCRILERITYASHGTCIGYNEGREKIGKFLEKEKELYNEIRPIQLNIIEDIIKLKEVFLSFETKKYLITKIHKIFILDINYRRLNQLSRIDKKMSFDFGEIKKENWTLKKIFIYFYKMCWIEKFQKILMVLNSLKLGFIGRFLVKIFIYKELYEVKAKKLWKKK